MKQKLIPWTVVVIFIAIFLIVNHQSRMDPSGSKSQNRQVRMDVVTAAVTLTWNADPDVDGYNLYYGTASGVYGQPVSVGAASMMITVGGLMPGTTYYFALKAFNRTCWAAPPPNCADFESPFSPELIYTVPTGATPFPGPTATAAPTATVAPTPLPTAAPTATPPPVTPTPGGTPGIGLVPSVINFTGVVGGPWPPPKSIQVVTSNGAAWTGFDTSPWFDSSAAGGPNGSSTTLTPHTEDMAASSYSYPITFSATGLVDRKLIVTMTLSVPATPSPTPIPTPTPTPSGSFTISFSPMPAVILVHGWTVKQTVTLTRTGGFSAPVAMSVSGLPPGISGSFSPVSITGTATKSTFTLVIDDCTGPHCANTYSFTVTAQGGGITRAAADSLVKQ